MLLKGGKIVADQGLKKVDLRIVGEKIAEIAADLTPQVGEELIDVSEQLILPGVIDSHTHFKLNARGTLTADDFYSGGRAAAFGGVTTVLDYADQLATSLLAGIEKRIVEAEESVVDYNLHLTLNNDFQREHLKQLKAVKEMGISSLKLFTTYQGLYKIADSKWPSLLKAAQEAKLLVTVHAEDEGIIEAKREEYSRLNKLGVEYHPELRPGQAEGLAVKSLANYAQEFQVPIYIAHLSSKEGYGELVSAQEQGIAIYAETTPHYLLLTRELLTREEASLHLMTPPLREQEDNQLLWEGIKVGAIELVATDHCAFSIQQKQRGSNCLEVLPGIPGVETLLPLLYTYGVKEGRITLAQLVNLLSTRPAQVFGLYPRKGSLELGSDADLVVFDPKQEWTLEAQNLHSQAGYSSFAGMKVKGKPIITILRGEVIVRDGDFLGQKGQGKFIVAGESVLYS